MSWNLNNKVALVTGGTKGIGKAIVAEFLALGAKVIAVARTQPDGDVLFQSPHFQFIQADVSNKDGIEKVVAELTQLDILVNNVGTNIRKKIIDFESEAFDKIISTNLFSVYELTRRCYPLLKQSKGNVVTVASVAGLTHLRSGVIYGMSKAALVQFTRNIAVEWAADGIRVNAVAPWYTLTPLTEGVLSNEDVVKEVLFRTPIKRIGLPEDVAPAVAFLAMDKAGYITGQTLAIDGGFTINGFS